VVHLFSQNCELKIENGIHFNRSYLMDAATFQNDEYFKEFSRIKNQICFGFRYKKPPNFLGFELGLANSGYVSVANFDGYGYNTFGKRRLGSIEVNYSQIEIPVRAIFYLKKYKPTKKHKNRKFQPEILGSIGFHYAKIYGNQKEKISKSIQRFDENGIENQRFTYEIYPVFYEKKGSLALEIGTNVEGYIAKKTKIVFGFRLAHGLTQVVNYDIFYTYVDGDPIHNFSGIGDASMFSKSDSFTFSVGISYLFGRQVEIE
jgi:hypothetical protein